MKIYARVNTITIRTVFMVPPYVLGHYIPRTKQLVLYLAPVHAHAAESYVEHGAQHVESGHDAQEKPLVDD
jgi:hypothetical protein